MIQDIAPHHFHNEYVSAPPKPESIFLYYRNNEILVSDSDSELKFPRFKDIPESIPAFNESSIYLFSIDGESYYLISRFSLENLQGFSFCPVDDMRIRKPKYLAFAGITGHQLFQWYQSRQFCGTCGQPLKHDHKERMLYCETCRCMEYPKLSPAVIVAIRSKNRLLLSKYAGRDYTRYALIAGFAEIGETIEETVHREVMEEVGLKVKNLRYYKSQPWAFSSTLLFGFFCDLDGDDTITLDEEELSMAVWMPREEVPYDDLEISLTREMMNLFKQGLDRDI